MTLDLTGWGSIAAHAAARGRQCWYLEIDSEPVRTGSHVIAWDTVGDGDERDLVWWCGVGNGHDGQGWTDRPGEATRYPSEYHADADLRTARKTVHRGVQRGRVDLQEVA